MQTALIVIAVATLVGLPIALAIVRRERRKQGKWLVECPETDASADIALARGFAVTGSALRVRACSRWPARQRCEQGCVN